MKSKKFVAILLSCLIIATLSSSLLIGVGADTPLISRSNASPFLTGGFWYESNTTNNQGPKTDIFWSVAAAMHKTVSMRMLKAQQRIQTHRQQGNAIYVQVKENTASSGTGSHTIYIAFVDASTGQTLWSSTTSDWDVFTGYTDIHASPTVYMTNGHYYELQCDLM